MTEKTYEDGYENGWHDAKAEFDEDSFNAVWELGYEQGKQDAADQSRELEFRRTIQAFHLMYHKGSYTFEKCWDEPCKNVRRDII